MGDYEHYPRSYVSEPHGMGIPREIYFAIPPRVNALLEIIQSLFEGFQTKLAQS